MTKSIPIEFRKNGYSHKLMKRTDTFAIYELSRPWGVAGYEVHKIRWFAQRETPYTVLEEGEYLANNEEFGTYAWSYQHLHDAEKKYRELQNG